MQTETDKKFKTVKKEIELYNKKSSQALQLNTLILLLESFLIYSNPTKEHKKYIKDNLQPCDLFQLISRNLV